MQLTMGSARGKRQISGLVMGLVVLGLIWEIAGWIISGRDQTLIMFGLSLVVVAIVVHILNDWRSGVLLFLIWLLFEDLARKYLGNSMTVYFAKDFLIGVAYLSFYAAKRKNQVEVFKIPSFCRWPFSFGLRSFRFSTHGRRAFSTEFWGLRCTSTMPH